MYIKIDRKIDIMNKAIDVTKMTKFQAMFT